MIVCATRSFMRPSSRRIAAAIAVLVATMAAPTNAAMVKRSPPAPQTPSGSM